MSQEKELKRIADAFEKIVRVYEDPSAYMGQISQSVQQALSDTQVQLPAVEGAPQVTAIEVKLSPEQKEEICKKAMADFEEQMDEFKGFIGQALSELPESTLKRIGEHLAKGEKFKLRRRQGCIYLDFGYGDEDFYLRM